MTWAGHVNYTSSMTKNEAAAEIARIYRNHSRRGELMSIARLAEHTDMTPAQIADGAKHLARTDADFNLCPESNQKMLTGMDHAYAVRHGDQDKHLLGWD